MKLNMLLGLMAVLTLSISAAKAGEINDCGVLYLSGVLSAKAIKVSKAPVNGPATGEECRGRSDKVTITLPNGTDSISWIDTGSVCGARDISSEPRSDTGKETFAITGGTGQYAGVAGTVLGIVYSNKKPEGAIFHIEGVTNRK